MGLLQESGLGGGQRPYDLCKLRFFCAGIGSVAFAILKFRLMHRDQLHILVRLLLDIFSCMGCFFGCFRVKDGDRRQSPLVSDHLSSKARDPLASKNRLASLLLEDQNSVEHPKSHDLQSLKISDGRDSEDQELKDEAKFLKSCGALLQTPVEIRKRLASEKLEVGDGASSKFHSWLPGTACKKLNWDEQQSQNPHSSYKLQEEKKEHPVQQMSALPEEKSRSFTSELQKMERCSGGSPNRSEECTQAEVQLFHGNNNESPSISSELPVSRTQCRTKTVRFENDNLGNTDFVSTRSALLKSETGNRKKCDSPDSDDGKHKQLVGPRCSPYPTPLRLTDDMQTPGTVYPAKTVNFEIGKNPCVRSLNVYSVLNPVENISQWTALKEDSLGEISNLNNVSICEDGENATKSLAIQDQQSPFPVETSLSSWVKPPSKEERGTSLGSPSKGMSASVQSSDIDRPIIGLVATHWNNEESSQIPPREWDGKGIPNSTTKYKEDQKVSWHATPFEERLEKALSDEKLFPRKLLTGRPIHFEESEESDTATSFLSTPPHRTVQN